MKMMTKKMGLSLGLVLFFGLCWFNSVLWSEENLVTNGGFEKLSNPEKLPDRWSKYDQSEDGQANFISVVDATSAHSGNNYVKCEVTKAGKTGFVDLTNDVRFKLEKGKTYLVRAYIKGEGEFMLRCYAYKEGKEYLSNAGPMNEKPENLVAKTWEEHRWEYTPKEENEVIWFAFHIFKGTFFFDDVSFSLKDAEKKKTTDLQEEFTRPLLTIAKTKKPPQIDGEIKNEEWEDAVVTTGFFASDGKLAPQQTTVYLTYDANSLYLAFKCAFSGTLKTEIFERDNALISNDEAVEAYLLPSPKPSNDYFQFLGNSAGAIYDGKGKDKNWNGGGWEFKNKVEMDQWLTSGVWTAELRVSFASLGVNTPKDGEEWLINFCRNWQPKGGTTAWTSWSHPNGYHNPQNFATLIFKEKTPAVKIISLGNLPYGEIKIAGLVAGNSSSEKKAKVSFQVITEESQKKILEKSSEITLSPDKSIPFTLEGSIDLATAQDLNIWLKVEDAGGKVYQTRHKYSCYPSFWVELTPLHNQGTLLVEVNVKRMSLPEGFTGVAEIVGTKTKKTIAFQEKTGQVSFPISDLKPGEYNLKTELLDNQGKTISAKILKFDVPEVPEWLTKKAGVSNKVPYPWTSVNLEGEKVSVWGREYGFQGTPFPARIFTKGEDILKEPVNLKVSIAGEEVKWARSEWKVVEQKETETRWKIKNTSPKVDLESEVMVGFDGIIKINFTLNPKSPSQIDSLLLELPFNRKNIKYVRALDMRSFMRSPGYTASINDIVPKNEAETIIEGLAFYSPSGWKYQDKYVDLLWLGDDERGLFCILESDENIHVKEKYNEIVNEGEKTCLRFFLIDNPTPFTKPLSYTIGLNASPTKPSLNQDKLRRVVWLPSLTHVEKYNLQYTYAAVISLDMLLKTYLLPEMRENLKNIVKDFHAKGIKVVTWIDYGFAATETPEFNTYGKEWKLEPGYTMPNGGNKGDTGTLVCTNSSWTDYFLWQIERLIDECDIDGIYMDMSGVSGCTNPYHNCGYLKDGKWQPKLNFFAEREFHIRLYNIFKNKKKDSVIFMHGGCYDPASKTFPDLIIQGEGWNSEKNYSRLTLARFRAEFMTTQYGTLSLFYPVLDLPWYFSPPGSRVSFEEIISFTLIHNVFPNMVHTGEGEIMLSILKILDTFGIDEATFIPYWKNDLIKSDSEDIKVSFYQKENKILCLVSNVGKKDLTTSLNINKKVKTEKAEDLQSKEEFAIKERIFKINIPAKRLRILQLK